MKKLKKNFYYIYKYGLTMYMYKVIVYIFGKRLKRKNDRLSRYILSYYAPKKEACIKKILETKLDFDVFQKYKLKKKNIPSQKRVWIMWWQGFDNAPEVVKMCKFNLEKNNPKLDLIFIDKNNLSQYIKIPNFIYEEFDRQKINFGLFSDYVRFSLLSEYGGVWLDSTCLVNQTIPAEVFEKKFYTSKGAYENKLTIRYPITSRIQSFFIASEKEGFFVTTIKKLLEEAIQKGYSDIDYLLVYYLMEIVIEKTQFGRNDYQSIPFNNRKILVVLNQLDSSYSNDISEILLDSETWIFKLTYKVRNKKDSNYQWILEKYNTH